MKMITVVNLFLALLLGCSATVQAEETASQQLIVVLTDSWTAVRGKMYRFEKEGDNWKQAGKTFDVVVGKHGLAPAIAAEGDDPAIKPKREGDGKAPAGFFTLGSAMGYGSSTPQGATFPYRKIMPELRCVDDVQSAYYNQIIDSQTVRQDWKSAEVMKRKDDLYKWLLTVNYNTEPIVKGRGSCIFIHVWRSKDKGTAGCTALPEGDLVQLMTWIKPELNPLLVQLTTEDYRQLWKSRGLPQFPLD